MYIDDSFQINVFLYAVGFGALLAVIYDLFRIIHRLIFKSAKGLIAKDLMFCITAGYMTFLFFLAVNYGRIRIYIFAAIILGFFCWYLSVSPLFLKVFFSLLQKFSALFTTVSAVMTFPFRALFSLFGKIFSGKAQFLKKYCDNLKNKSKIYLKIK